MRRWSPPAGWRSAWRCSPPRSARSSCTAARISASAGRQRPRGRLFPFYIGLLLSAASLGNLLLALCRWRALGTSFVARTAFRRVLAVFLPIAAYVAAMPFAGIYLASALFIAWFMWRDRSRDKPYGVPLIVTLSCGAALASYLVFAVWFKVPLDAGILVDLAAFVGSARP